MVATYTTEKSSRTNEATRQAAATSTSTNTARAAGRARLIQAALFRAAPMIGNVPSTSATASATISEKLPSSAIIDARPV